MADRKYDQDVVNQVRIYLKFLLLRANGSIKTCARLIRDFVLTHPEYKHDSIVSNSIAYDLVKSLDFYIIEQEKAVEEAMFTIGGVSYINYGPNQLKMFDTLIDKKKPIIL